MRWVMIIKYWSDWKKLFTELVLLIQIYREHVQTRCVCETQMPPIMANSKDGQGHKDKYLDTSRKILLQEMLMWNMKALALTVQKL